MTYLDVRLSAEDSWVNKYMGVKLPHDGDVKDPDKLAQLSGPVTTYYSKCCNNPKTVHTQEGLLHVCIGQYCDNCGFYWMANTGWTLDDSIQLWREVNNHVEARLLYVKRNQQGVIIGLSEKDPEDNDGRVNLNDPNQDVNCRTSHSDSR